MHFSVRQLGHFASQLGYIIEEKYNNNLFLPCLTPNKNDYLDHITIIPCLDHPGSSACLEPYDCYRNGLVKYSMQES